MSMESVVVDVKNLTVLEHFIKLCQQDPSKLCFVFLDEQGKPVAEVTRGELHQLALKLAYYLINDLQIKPGDCVLLVYPQSLDFIVALLACMYAGIIPAPVAPPNPFRDIKYELETFRLIAKNCDAKAILTNGKYSNIKTITSIKNFFSLSDTTWSNLPWYRTDKLDKQISVSFTVKKSTLADIAYYQFTSGSTTSPRGIAVTYSNLLHQLYAIAARSNTNENSIGVIWLPHYHSMCLVNVIYTTLQNGCLTYFFSPLVFLKRPTLWFELITCYQGTHTIGTESAVKKMLEQVKIGSHHKFDLSSLQVFGVGGEPNNLSVINEFCDRFKEFGFSAEAYSPAYGLSEHTLIISMTAYNQPYYSIIIDKEIYLNQNKFAEITSNDACLNFVSNGKPFPEVEIRIIHPDLKHDCKPGEIGEIAVSSPSVTLNIDERQHLDKSYLYTGDLGTMLNGHLFVTGRLKDIMIINGRNIYLNDIDHLILNAHPIVIVGKVAALSIDDKLVIMLETDKTYAFVKKEIELIFNDIHQILMKSLSVICDSVLVCKPETILRTNTGKIRRLPTKEALLAGKLSNKIILSSQDISKNRDTSLG